LFSPTIQCKLLSTFTVSTDLVFYLISVLAYNSPRTEPLDTWGSRPQNDRDWGDSEPVIQTLVDELYKRFEENRRIAGFTAEDDEENFVDDAETHRLGLDFEGASNYRDGPESPLSAASQNGEAEYYDDDQGSQVVLSQESLDFFKVNNDISQFGELEKQSRDAKRRHTSMAKRRRMSMFSSSVTHTKSFLNSRKSLFIRPSRVSTSTPAFILESGPNFCRQAWSPNIARVEECPVDSTIPPFHDPEIMLKIFSFLPQNDIMSTAALVSKSWFDASAHSYANFMRRSVGCGDINSDDELDDDCSLDGNDGSQKDSFAAMEKSWPYLTATFPWAMFLSDGAFKRVYKVFNRSHRTEEAVSVMDLDAIKKTGNMSVVGAELAVSVLLSSLVRLGVCPNFVVTRAAFTSSFEPPAYSWGDSNNRRPKGNQYVSPEVKKRPPKEPKHRGRYQYIRQELCDEGDVEEYLKAQPDESIPPDQARYILFQIAFAIHAAADRFSLKHYDVKLLNVFLKRVRSDKQGDVILRYGLGEHTFALRQNRDQAIIAKLADYGTANVDSGSNGQQVTIAQFTTFENTPPDFLLLGDKAQQGHGHDYFGLGLCMLHLMTGHAPYEEILEDVYCPDNLKRELKKVWENEEEPDFSVVRSLVLADCFMDDEGHILEGEPDETFYDTLYKFLVLFGIPDKDPAFAESKAMKAIKATLTSESRRNLARKGRCSKRMSSDASKFHSDRRKYSLTHGNNTFITRARESLLSMKGGMDLLLSLVDFNPQTRATALDVLNSEFMAPLRETSGATYSEDDDVSSFTAFATHY
jgi:serine/threonine protein kinase